MMADSFLRVGLETGRGTDYAFFAAVTAGDAGATDKYIAEFVKTVKPTLWFASLHLPALSSPSMLCLLWPPIIHPAGAWFIAAG
jgi:hypothetical protein